MIQDHDVLFLCLIVNLLLLSFVLLETFGDSCVLYLCSLGVLFWDPRVRMFEANLLDKMFNRINLLIRGV